MTVFVPLCGITQSHRVIGAIRAIPGIGSLMSHWARVLGFFLPQLLTRASFLFPCIAMRCLAIGVHDWAVMRPHISYGTCFAPLLNAAVPRNGDGHVPPWCSARASGTACPLRPQDVPARANQRPPWPTRCVKPMGRPGRWAVLVLPRQQRVEGCIRAATATST